MKNADTATGFALKTLLVVCTVWSVAVLYAFFTSRLPGEAVPTTYRALKHEGVMYKWQIDAEKCEVCNSIGRVQSEQMFIRRVGLCFKCSPSRPQVPTITCRFPQGSKSVTATKRARLSPDGNWE